MDHVDAQLVRWHAQNNAQNLQQDATLRVLAAAVDAIRRRGIFHIVLAGGNTPQATYTALRRANTDWSRWQIYYGDERCLPVDDAERNSAMASASWLDHVAIPAANIHTMRGELGANAAARDYADLLRGVGDFDLVILGIGEDGHTASLFPDHDWGTDADAADTLAIVDSPKPPPQRVSMTAHRLSRARQVMFLIDGPSKRDAVDRWRRGERIAASAICPQAGVDVLLDAALLA